MRVCPPSCAKVDRQVIDLALALAIAALWFLSGCGGSFVFVSSNNGRLLVAVHVDPASADPLHAQGGQVQFIASGTFSASPTAVNPLPGVQWTVDRPFFSTAPDLGRASITPDGIAQCGPGFIGTVTVF